VVSGLTAEFKLKTDEPVEPASAGPDAHSGLRGEAMRAGLYLVSRHGADVVLSVVGEPFIAREIGPFSYGLWIAARRIYGYLWTVGAFGIDAYLLRKEDEVSTEQYHQAFTLLLLLGTACAALGIACLPLVTHLLGTPNLTYLAAALLLGLPIFLSAAVPQARLERAFDYRTVTRIELTGRGCFYAVAIVLSLLRWGAWALIIGYWFQQLLNSVLFFAGARYVPRLRFSIDAAREMASFGAGYSASAWIYRLTELVNPLVVGYFAGAAAVGYVGLAERIVLGVGFARMAAWRLSMVVLARFQSSRQRLAAAVTEAMQLQVMAIGPCLLAVGLVLPVVVRIFFGARWQPLEIVYPFIAGESLIGAIFSMQSSALFVIRRNWMVVSYDLVHLVLFAGGAALMVPALGLWGYGIAEFMALPAYWMAHKITTANIGPVSYKLTGAMVGATMLGLFWVQIGWPAALGVIAVAAWPATWRAARIYWGQLLDVLTARAVAPSDPS
jgi:O-antigen/teichoic acid export membrane protein